MRVVPCLGLVVYCLALTGCSAFGKKPAPASTPPPRAAADAGLTLPSRAGSATSNEPTATPASLTSLLAGQIIDSFNRPPPPTFIQVTLAPENGSPSGAPIEVAADAQGYFTIQGLQRGKHYQLTARARNGDKIMAGTTWATPPNPKVLIQVSEDYVRTSTPAVPGAPIWPGVPAAAGPAKTPERPAAAATDPSWGPAGRSGATAPPAPEAGPRRAADLGPPTKIKDGDPGLKPVQETLPATPLSTRPENIASPGPLTRSDPITAVPGPGTRIGAAGITAQPGPAAAALPAVSGGRAPVPSCSLTGRQLYNFSLNDLNGQPWEYRQHRGRLVLLDFWGTWCMPCQHAIPHLNIMHDRFSPYGLEVIGIAYEEGTPVEQAQKVNRVRQRLRMNYRVLLGGERATCPVRTQFEVRSFPTLVLLDESSRIIWRSEGLNLDQLKDLELVIQKQLGTK